MFLRRELQALQLLFPNSSASGIARALRSFLLYIFKFPDSRYRPLVSLSDNLTVEGGRKMLMNSVCTLMYVS